jgi:hypothetical protein
LEALTSELVTVLVMMQGQMAVFLTDYSHSD